MKKIVIEKCGDCGYMVPALKEYGKGMNIRIRDDMIYIDDDLEIGIDRGMFVVARNRQCVQLGLSDDGDCEIEFDLSNQQGSYRETIQREWDNFLRVLNRKLLEDKK